MILRLFKRSDPVTIFTIVIMVAALWVSSFIRLKGELAIYFDMNAMPLYDLASNFIGTNAFLSLFVSLALVIVMAFLIVDLNTSLFFINERTFLPALFYVMIGALFPSFQTLNPAIFGAIFIMIAVRKIMDTYRVKGTAYNIFDAGIIISTGSLFYADLLWFGLIIFAGIALLRPGNLKELVLAFLGILTPYVLTIGYYYIATGNVSEFLSVLFYNLYEKHSQYAFTPLSIVATLFVAVITIMSISHVFLRYNTKKIHSRKTFSLLLWIFLISIAVFLFVPSASVEMIWITGIPTCYFLSQYFLSMKRKVLPEILFLVLFLLILSNQLYFLLK